MSNATLAITKKHLSDVFVTEHQIVIEHGPFSNQCIYAKKWVPSHSITQSPLILLHDSLGCVGLWRDFPALLANALSRPVIAYDRLGFGLSSARSDSVTSNFIAEEATVIFPHIKRYFSFEQFALLGHSVGGGMAIYIGAYEKTCEAVITMAAQAYVEDKTLAGIRQAQIAFSDDAQVNRLRKWHSDKTEWVLNAWINTWLSPSFKDWTLADCINDVTCPVLAIHGDNDEYGSNAFPRYITDNVSGESKLLIMNECGHSPHKERASETIAVIAHFIKD